MTAEWERLGGRSLFAGPIDYPPEWLIRDFETVMAFARAAPDARATRAAAREPGWEDTPAFEAWQRGLAPAADATLYAWMKLAWDAGAEWAAARGAENLSRVFDVGEDTDLETEQARYDAEWRGAPPSGGQGEGDDAAV